MTGDWRERFAVKDERGNTYSGWRVLSRAPNAGGNAMWRCQCVCCGEHRSIAGIKLRSKPPACACQKPKGRP
jgi:hypothetical protein